MVALQPEALSAFFGDIRSAMTQIQRSLDRLDPGGSRSTSRPYLSCLQTATNKFYTGSAEESGTSSTHHEAAKEQEIHEIPDATPGNVVDNDEPESE